jgi:hypothetical protein
MEKGKGKRENVEKGKWKMWKRENGRRRKLETGKTGNVE